MLRIMDDMRQDLNEQTALSIDVQMAGNTATSNVVPINPGTTKIVPVSLFWVISRIGRIQCSNCC